MTDSIVTTALPFTLGYAPTLSPDAQAGQPSKFYYLDVNPDYGNGSSLDILISDAAAVNKQISNILATQIGTEQFEPLYGSMIPQLLFDNVSASTAFRIKSFILTSLTEWMSNRISVNHRVSDAVPNYTYPGYDITVAYSINYTGVANVFRGKLRA